jgi:hypothetical protein
MAIRTCATLLDFHQVGVPIGYARTPHRAWLFPKATALEFGRSREKDEPGPGAVLGKEVQPSDVAPHDLIEASN